jgi:predicted RecA/RadA family phage recombinase
MQTLWNYDEAIAHLVDVPAFIEQDITASQVAAIIQGGCASGAYMPAVTYHTARETMNEHGDDVLQFIEDAYGEIPKLPETTSWSSVAVFYLSTAVELWASGIHDELTEAIEDEAEEAETVEAD